MSNPDVIVVGAGFAGIGAGLELQARGIPFVVLEAADRIGGRAHTDRTSLPEPWDHGCHWLHCADVNPLVAWADRLGARYMRQERFDHFRIWSGGGWADAGARAEDGAALAAAFAAIYEAGGRGEDVPVADVLPDAGRWAPAVRHILQLLASEDPELVSAAGYADYDDTEVNWPVITGLGDLAGRMGDGLPVRLGTAVTAIEQRRDGVTVRTARGAIEARAAIVTVSTNVLRCGAIAFGPGPARELLELVDDVPCGAYEKVAIALRQSPVEGAGTLFCMVDMGDGSVPLDFQVAPSESPLMIAHMGGGMARELAAEGAPAMTAFAVERLAAAFGSAVRGQIVSTAVTGWQENPFVMGAYSYARPGCAAGRRAMMEADTGTVAFAGEAFSRRWQATAHGAYQSGRDVAARLCRTMQPAR